MGSLPSGSRTGKTADADRPPRPPGGAGTDRRAVRQGTAILGGLLLLAAAIFFLEPIERWLAAGPRITVTASGARGLVPGAEVWLAGTRAGRVTSIRFRSPEDAPGERVVVRAVLNEGAAGHLRAGARASIRPSALLAPTVLFLAPGPPGAPPFDFGDTLAVTEPVTARELLARARETQEAGDTLAAVAGELAGLLERGDGTLARLRRDTALLRTLARHGRGIRSLAAALDGNRGLAALLDAREDGAFRALGASLGQVGAAAEERAGAAGELERALARLGERSRRLDSRLAAGLGSAGRLRADGELQAQIRQLRSRVARARAYHLADPLRWLRIRLF